MFGKRMRGGDKIDDIQSQLDEIQQQVNQLKGDSKPVMQESMSEEITMEEAPAMEEQTITKTWVDDKSIKFKGVNSGNVTLSFSRIIDLLNNNIKKMIPKKIGQLL